MGSRTNGSRNNSKNEKAILQWPSNSNYRIDGVSPTDTMSDE